MQDQQRDLEYVPPMPIDLYALTMSQAHFYNKTHKERATFDMFIRSLPENWGFFIASGIREALNILETFSFSDEDVAWLSTRRSANGEKMFRPEFLDYIRSFVFLGDVSAVKDGTPIAPGTVVMKITGDRIETQLVEAAILGTINFATLITTKANRIVRAANGKPVVEFGLRRAQGLPAGLSASRYCYIAGCVGTSNVGAGMTFDIPIFGTMAHSWVMAFENELDAFRAWVKTYPRGTTLLIDTYDIEKGAKNAIAVALELRQSGNNLGAVRIDSGEPCKYSVMVRNMLDEAGLQDVKIQWTNDLNEYKIDMIDPCPIDSYGVGTEMVTGKPIAALGGVYKLVEDVGGSKMKLSSGKSNYPGRKQVYRIVDGDGNYQYDYMALTNEDIVSRMGKEAKGSFPLLEIVMANGIILGELPDDEQVREYLRDCVSKMPEKTLRITKSEPYKLETSIELTRLVDSVTRKIKGRLYDE